VAAAGTPSVGAAVQPIVGARMRMANAPSSCAGNVVGARDPQVSSLTV